MPMSTIWLIVLIIALVIELVTLDLASIWFCLGAVVSYILSVLNFAEVYQYIAFIVVSLVSFFITRPLASKFLRGNVVKTNADRIIGKRAVVLKEITPDTKGEIKVLGAIWTATTLDDQTIEKDKHVEVIAIEGVKAIVKEI